MRVPITLDLHVPNFTFSGVEPDQLFDKIVEIAQTLEASGFSSISVMDHLHQIAMVGPPENNMLEGSTLLSAIAARTEKLTLGLLVGSVTYRNPALAAKITTTIDIISRGRVWHGIGAGWFEAEHVAYGFDYPELKVRLAMEEEALQVVRAMFTQDKPSFHGTYFHIDEPHNNPRPLRGDIPILIGGSGEKKTLRMVAKYGDGCNLFGDGATTRRSPRPRWVSCSSATPTRRPRPGCKPRSRRACRASVPPRPWWGMSTRSPSRDRHWPTSVSRA
jgi:F420-dependent oxidoreductase-like protein